MPFLYDFSYDVPLMGGGGESFDGRGKYYHILICMALYGAEPNLFDGVPFLCKIYANLMCLFTAVSLFLVSPTRFLLPSKLLWLFFSRSQMGFERLFCHQDKAGFYFFRIFPPAHCSACGLCNGWIFFWLCCQSVVRIFARFTQRNHAHAMSCEAPVLPEGATETRPMPELQLCQLGCLRLTKMNI